MKATSLEILRHSLGLDRRGRGRQYRNHFVAGTGHDDFKTCRQLVAEGLMQEHAGNPLTGGEPCFVVTEAGKQLATTCA